MGIVTETFEWIATGSLIREGEIRAVDAERAIDELRRTFDARHGVVRLRVLDPDGEVLAEALVASHQPAERVRSSDRGGRHEENGCG